MSQFLSSYRSVGQISRPQTINAAGLFYLRYIVFPLPRTRSHCDSGNTYRELHDQVLECFQCETVLGSSPQRMAGTTARTDCTLELPGVLHLYCSPDLVRTSWAILPQNTLLR